MRRLLRTGAALTACVLVSWWPSTVAGGSVAQTADAPAAPDADGSTFSLTVSPTRLVVGPRTAGEDQTVDVTNGGTEPVTVTVQKRNFTGGIDGSLDFQEDAPYAAAEWVSLDRSTFVVGAGATTTVTATIDIPKAPEPGDHQVALVFLVPAGETEANVRINRGIAIPVYVTVPGPTDDSAAVTDLQADGFSTGSPVDVTATVHNTGTVHRDFRDGSPLRVRADGKGTDFADFTVMRGGTREITTAWDPPLICICHPSVAIVNADGTTVSKSVRVIVFPLPVAGALVASLVTVLLLTRFGRRRYRRQVAAAAAALAPPAGAEGA